MARTLSDAGVSIQLTSDDVVAVRLANEETLLNGKIRVLQTARREANAAVEAISRSITDFEQTYQPTANAMVLTNSLKTALEVYYGTAYISATKREMRETPEEGVYCRVTYYIYRKIGDTDPTRHYFNENLPATSDHLAALFAHEKALTKVADIDGEIAQLRRQLANLPSLARQARSSLVKSIIGSSDTGKLLIQAIEGTQSVEAT